MSRALADLLYRWRRLLCGVAIAGAVLLAPRANITDIDNDLTAWFSRDDPVYQEYERFSDEFGGTRTLIVALEAPSRDRLESREALAAIDAISRAIERVDAVDRVSSLATATVVDARPPVREGDDTELDVRPLIDDLATRSPAAVVARARDDDLLRGDLVSEDGTVASIVVFFDESRIDAIRSRVLDEIRAVVARELPAGFTAHYNGSLEITETYNRITLANQAKFTPPIFLFTTIALFVLFRSWRQTALTMAAVLVSLLWTLGLYDLFGLSYNVLSSMIVPLVVVLAIADDVHIVQHYGEARRTRSPEEAFKDTVRHLAAPLFGASGTTALGMLSLATSDVVAVREFGIGAAVGVMVDYAISLVLMPTVLGWLKPETRPAPQQTWFTVPLARVAGFSTRRAGWVMATSLVLTLVAVAGLRRLDVDTNHISFFSANHPLGQSARVIDGKLSGIYTYQILLEGPADSLRDPDALAR
ncbi:MAG TPA: MMPL family transporter, partial [Vicinamibacterales bacterium]|nr:MMPL family transporter [Vicinamibacterales bacterium]